MKRRFIFISIGLLFSIVLAVSALATSYIVYNTKISIYAQSRVESTAHLIRIEEPMYNG